MKKLLFLSLYFIFFSSMSFANDTPWSVKTDGTKENTVQIKIKQNGKIKTITTTTTTKSDTSAKTTIQPTYQNYNGNTDTLMVKESKQALYSHQEKKIEPTVRSDIANGDPYAVKIQGQKYYLIKDNNTTINVDNFLGYYDHLYELFSDLKNLNTNNDTKISKEELKKAHIRFVALNNGKLQIKDKTKDYNLENILYIDLKNLNRTVNKGQIGSFGYFDIYVKENGKTKKYIGFITFDSDEVLREYISE